METTWIEARIGDLLRIEGRFGISHYGIYVGPQAPDGQDVVHADKESGVVRFDYFEDFAGGRPVYVEAEASSVPEQQEIVERALTAVSKPYSLFGLNCEHVATYALGGRADSPGLRKALTLAGLAGLLWFWVEG